MIALLLVLGIVAGLLAGLLGVGGGILLVPVLRALAGPLGLPADHMMHVIVATSMAVVIPTALSSTRAHARKGAVDAARLWRWAPAMAVGAFGAGVVAAWLPTAALAVVFGVVALGVGIRMALASPPPAPSKPWPAGLERSIAGVVGAISSWMGIGGGTLSVPLLNAGGLAMHRAVGTGAALGLAVSLPAFVGWTLAGTTDAEWLAQRPSGGLYLGYIDGWIALVLVPTMVLAAPWGATLAHRLPAARLRRLFGGFLALAALGILVRTL
jgi:uncharacterized membrane protein YfcA